MIASLRLRCLLLAACVICFEFTTVHSIDIGSLFKMRESSREKFDKFLQESTKEVINSVLSIGFRVPKTMADAIDMMSQKLLEASKRDPDIMDDLMKELHINEIVDAPLRRETIDKNFFRYVKSKPSSLTDVLLDVYTKPHITHSSSMKKNIDAEKLGQVEEVVNDLPLGEKYQLEKAMTAEYGSDVVQTREDACPVAPRRPKRSLGSLAMSCAKGSMILGAKAAFILVRRVAQVGITVLDHLFMAPEMLSELPVIGETIREYKKKGEPLYKIIQFVRSNYYLHKVRTRGDLVDDEPVDDRQISEAKRLIGETGRDILVMITRKALEHVPAGVNEKQEFMSRTIMAFLTSLLEKGFNF